MSRIKAGLEKHMYKLDKVLELEKPMTFLIGGTNIGKTYQVKQYIKRRVLDHGEKFVILRDFASQFQRDYTVKLFRDCDFGYPLEVKKNTIYLKVLTSEEGAKKPVYDWQEIGYEVSLNEYEDYKGNSYSDVTTYLYDEFDTHRGKKVGNRLFKIARVIDTFSGINDYRFFATMNRVNTYVEDLELLGIDTFNMPASGIIEIDEDIVIELCSSSEELLKAKENSSLGRLYKKLDKWENQVENQAGTMEWQHLLKPWEGVPLIPRCLVDLNEACGGVGAERSGYLEIARESDGIKKWVISYSKNNNWPGVQVLASATSPLPQRFYTSPYPPMLRIAIEKGTIQFTSALAYTYAMRMITIAGR